MQNLKRNNPWLKTLSLSVAVWFALFALFVPALHQHHSFVRLSAVQTKIGGATHAVVSPTTLEISTDTSVLGGVDNCLLCHWLSAEHTVFAFCIPLLVLVTACATVLLAARLAALCARPTPFRGLRAPPVFASLIA